MQFYSPLRYPGGKNKLSNYITQICIDNKIQKHYVEPFAGGASVALFLLLNNFVRRITINDNDRSIYAFWYSVLNHSKKLCEAINKTDINIDNWLFQKSIQKKKESADIFELGFSTLFLNRTNISGIINGGVMGGLDQKGPYKMDCRFNKIMLINRIKRISERKNQIKIYKKDAFKLIDKINKEEDQKDTIYYFDPPYYIKGSTLYMNHFKKNHHSALCKKIKNIKKAHWIVSYDNLEPIRNLYSSYRYKEYSFNHSAYKSKIGNEILFFSTDLSLPLNWEQLNPVSYKINDLS